VELPTTSRSTDCRTTLILTGTEPPISGGKVCIFSQVGTHLAVDITGYFT
jgi:hypothetical protein